MTDNIDFHVVMFLYSNFLRYQLITRHLGLQVMINVTIDSFVIIN